MNNRTKEIFIVLAILILQTILYIIGGTQKSYIHMDEAYSLGLASYNKTEIQANKDFYNTWHSKDYYEDYLAVNDNESNSYKSVYINQENDVHPPLYYLILRFAMGFSPNHYSKWPGIIINIIIYIFITLFTYLILQKLLKNYNHYKEKSIILAFISSITIASLSNVLYIRMYSLSTLNILVTTYLHIKLFESQKLDVKTLIFITISTIIGVLTHYYYLFYLAAIYIILAIKYLKEKQYKKLIFYTLSLAISGGISLLIWPYLIKHLFFGYRGKGVLSNLHNIPNAIKNIFLYLVVKLNYFGFNNVFFIILIMIIGFYISSKTKNKTYQKSEISKLVAIPCLFYFLLVSICSPYVELRYISPVCGLIFILTLYYLYVLLNSLYEEKKANKITIFVIIIILVSPFIFKIEPEVMFSDKKELVQKLENELNVPTIYFFNSHNNRFLDDIYLFSKLENSYIAKNIKYTDENIQKILKDKNLSKGIIVLINDGQDKNSIIKIVKEATNLKTCKHLQKLNASDIYYLK